jgi:PAS domain S-box-containing protein
MAQTPEVPARHDETPDAAEMLRGGGEMGAHMRRFDWSLTSLGPVETWPHSLTTAVRMLLSSRYPMFVWWGRELINIYNDAYIPVLGARHPQALGQFAPQIWADIWPVIGPQAEIVLNQGQATWNESILLLMERHGYIEETYFTFSYSPVPDDSGGVGGVFCACTEDTGRVLSERRLKTLSDLGERSLAEAKTAELACRAAAETLAENAHDFPFALIYLLDANGKEARLAEQVNLAAQSSASPATITLDGEEDVWRFAHALQTQRSQVVETPEARFGRLPAKPWTDDRTKRALVLPLARAGGQELPAGFLVAGVSPRLALDEDYRSFLELAARQIATAISNARAYEEERQRAEALAALDAAKTTFFSNVSHEFRTPLTLMLGPLEETLAQREQLPAADYERLEVVHRNALRLLKLVNTLLDFSRIEAGRITATYAPTNLAALTAELASLFRSAVERAGLRLLVDCPPLPEPVYVAPELWEKIVFNLLSNAFKFTFAGEIAVALHQRGAAVELTVQDTGTGIPVEELPHLFERFHRVQGARGRTFEGSGIGLALVQELVRLHGGEVRVASEVNQGTTFTVTIPTGTAHLPAERIVRDQPVPALERRHAAFVEEALHWLPDQRDEGRGMRDEGSGASALRPPPSARILLADDNADMRAYIARLLSPQYEVVAVANGEAALQAARAEQFDLVLSDVMMPKLDGFGLLAALRADLATQALPVILLSARAGEEARVEGFQAGADDYLTKPFSAHELLARVRTTLALAQTRRKAELQQRASEQRLQLAISANRMVTWEWLPREDRITTSASLAEIYGLPAVAGVAEGFALVWPEDKAAHQAKVQQIAATGGEYVSEFRITRPDNGELVWLEERAKAFVNDDRQIERVVGVTIDITERKLVEQRLRSLQAVTASFAQAQTLAEVRRVMLHEVTQALGADGGGLRRVEHDVLVLDEHERGAHMTEEHVRRFAAVPLQADHPAAEVVRTETALFFGRADEIIARYPHFERAVRDNRTESNAHLPLRRGTEVFGVLSMHFPAPRRWDDAERAFALALADRAAVAYERARLLEAERDARRQLEESQRYLEAAAAERERQVRFFDTTLATVKDYVYTFDREGRFLFANQTLLDLWQLPKEAAIGKTMAELAYPPEVEERLLEGLREVFATRRMVTNETYYTNPAGQSGYYENILSPVFGDDGAVVMVTGSSRDVTERKRAAMHAAFIAEIGDLLARARQAAALMEVVGERIANHLHVSRVFFIEIDPERQLSSVLYDWCADDLPSTVGVYPLEEYASQDFLREILAGNVVAIRDVRTNPITAASAERFAALQIGATLNAPFLGDGRLQFMLAVQHRQPYAWRDDEIDLLCELTGRIWTRLERIRAEREREQLLVREQHLRQQAEEASRLKDEFLATVSHELRTPLTAFLGYAQLLQSRKRDEAYIARTVEKMVRSAKTQAQLIEDLLDIGRIVSGKLRLDPVPVDLRSIIGAALDTTRPAAEAKAITVEVELDPAATMIVGDAGRLQQVMWNLLTNAVKFTPPGGSIQIGLERHERDAVLSVRDTGQGISAEFLPYVFDRFRQADGSTNRTHGGLGLGLSIVRHLVELHGGTVTATSDGAGRGATFRVWLPLANSSTSRGVSELFVTDENRAENCPPELAGLRVLVVDDQPDILELLHDLLASCGAHVRLCDNARDALAAVRTWRPDVLVSDIAMPGDDGYWLIQHVRALPPEEGGALPAVAVTAYVRVEDRLRVLSAGFEEYATKPVEPAELRAVVARLARRAAAE